jgi:O-antigen/teichoic acid export membrane protein
VGKQTGFGAVIQSFGAKLSIVLLNAGTGIVTARLLQPAGRGELAAILVWPQFISGMITLGIPSALTYHLRKRPEASGGLLSASLVIGSLTSIVASLLAFLFLPHLLHQYSHAVTEAARWVVLNTIVGALVLITRAALEARGNFSRSNLSLILPPVLTLLGLGILAVAHRLTPTTAAVCYIVSGLPAIAIALAGVRDLLHGFAIPLPGAARMLFSYGSRSYGIEICSTLSLYIDQVFVVTVLSPARMGAYVVALSLSRVLLTLHQSVAAVLFPRAVGMDIREVLHLTGRALRVSMAFSLLGCGAMLLCGPGLLNLLYGKSYANVNAPLQILAVEAVLSGSITVLAQAFMALNRPGIVTMMQALGLAITVPLLMILVPRYGVLGAAASVFLSTLARSVLTYFSFRFVLREPAPGFLPRSEDFRWMLDRSQALMNRKPLPSNP